MSKTIIFIPMDEKLQKQIAEDVQSFPWLQQSELDLVHIFRVESYPYIVPPYIYPTDEQRPAVEKAIKDILKGFGERCGFQGFETHCVFGADVKSTAIEFVKNVKPALVITGARGKHGIQGVFSSSFTDNLIKYSPYPVLATR